MSTTSSNTEQSTVDDADDVGGTDLNGIGSDVTSATPTSTIEALTVSSQKSIQKNHEEGMKSGLTTEMTMAIVAASVIVIVGILVLWTILDRKRRKKSDMELESEVEQIQTGMQKKRKRRKRRKKVMKKGPKPVIPVKASKQLKKALSEFLELQTETLASVAEEDFSSTATGNESRSKPSAPSESKGGKRIGGGHGQSQQSVSSNKNVEKHEGIV
ncbi:hypothetical protein OESDEN_04589 [Oesophagostomum dentatum]|uniref:Uncharacterized protein n=1 Tax=Oesophagostomum dentatum TaxID=61180 RepID=A0A0B1TJ72_OESDE|nr:hypothetical protein OESDEN_04589 [Oesophagostomum dentatum]